MVMGTKRDPTCHECGGDGYVDDWMGGCGDPECCGGPIRVQCRACDNDWNQDDEDSDDGTQ